MLTLIELPKLYENMDEATIGPWKVPCGAKVSQGQHIVELISDKTIEDFEAPCDGVLLAIYAQEKSTVPMGYVLGAIGAEGEVPPADIAQRNAALMQQHQRKNAGGIDLSAVVLAADGAKKGSYQAAPAAKAFARQSGVNLEDVAKFCGRGMIHRKDVEDYIASAKKPEANPAAAAMPASAAAPSAAPRVAIVTGAGGAIGSAIAEKLASQGVTVALHCNSSAHQTQALAERICASGAKAKVFQADLTAPGKCEELVNAVLTEFGRIDILVNNAGALADATVSFMSDEQWAKSLEINLSVPFRMLRAVSMIMARQRWGRIVNMSSDAGRMGSANRSNYASAKEGLLGLTRSAARELAGLGIRVNAISPGFVESQMTANIPPAKMKDILRDIPTHRLGKPQDIANLAAFLASDEADYITGQVISIDGGLFMG